MELNPLHSSDLNYGQPALFNEILDDLLDNTHKTDIDKIIADLLASQASTGDTTPQNQQRGTTCVQRDTDVGQRRYTEAVHLKLNSSRAGHVIQNKVKFESLLSSASEGDSQNSASQDEDSRRSRG